MMSNKVIVFCFIFLFFRKSTADSNRPDELINAINGQWGEYARLSSYSVQVSMVVSHLAYKINKNLFSASDIVGKEAKTIEYNMMAISHQMQVEDVLKSRCINDLGIPEVLKRKDEDVEHAAACFLLEANKGFVLETSLTGVVNEFRGRMIKGIRALERCSTKETSACIAKIIKDSKESAEILRRELNTLKEKILILEDKLPRTIASCRRLASKSLSVLRKLTETIKAC
ncbi:uncharacterized protein LOC106666489 isoform X2 [Cimex lectularius]|uniref:Venom protein n=1 Tax=Cimex lectularius TaxID=79782 RepID=A0A8I6THF2_CIMLE|nr:uncharacterized protein LOC106666489 isoform X2 [Cimex lectularius]